jgi:hypothetical protein
MKRKIAKIVIIMFSLFLLTMLFGILVVKK